jgi:23S rRNA (cytidine1920-2'-O)/16S rRNA (cytidine1409-2'-O)-methyltransferase
MNRKGKASNRDGQLAGAPSHWEAARLALGGRSSADPRPATPKRMRLDQALTERGYYPSREKAKRAILAGQVSINQQPARKPSDWVRAADQLAVKAIERYVSRGGYKLEGALRTFQLNVQGCTALDLGASTGGFTDCLLQKGASQVYAVDVGCGQLAWKLRIDPRVVVKEKTNARHLNPACFSPDFAPVDLVVIDCSFISLQKILRPAIALLRENGKVIALIKPQFEAGKAEADRGAGVITDPRVHERVLHELQAFVGAQANMRWLDWCESPLLGPAGNKEFFALIEKVS